MVSKKKTISKESVLVSANNCLTHRGRSIRDNPNAMHPTAHDILEMFSFMPFTLIKMAVNPNILGMNAVIIDLTMGYKS